ncbi:MAG: tRNA uridine-5-carboxymethylaminomethyl(34) synthesis GTPase MnmE [Hydrogenibacillus sp.]|nr:tRNA uridine-5-carboxymethylaminomethyl(34) synthesis GTPase MnmE [Hydrogenibacillus sp.]
MFIEETIAAVVTPLGEGGVAIIRVSGSEAIRVAEPLFRGRRPLSGLKSHTLAYGHVVDPESGAVIDEALVAVMRAPRSFTREDVVEIHVHGGVLVAKTVLSLVLRQGARLAEPGEFTLRAFLNGRIDLAQAEATIDVIRAKSEAALKAGARALQGAFGAQVRALKAGLLRLTAEIEVHIDYPEHDAPEATYVRIVEGLTDARASLESLMRAAAQGSVLRDGVETAIVGLPNAGKSSLLNAMLRSERAIVTDVPGTTRDLIEAPFVLGGIPLLLVDTAGIRETADVVEAIGVQRTREILERAALVLVVLDGSRPLTAEDASLLHAVRGRTAVVVVNKADLEVTVREDDVRSLAPSLPIVFVSAKTRSGFEALEAAVLSVLGFDAAARPETLVTANARHLELIRRAHAALDEALAAAREALPYDVILIDLRRALGALGEILGEDVRDDVIKEIFANFCLGK